MTVSRLWLLTRLTGAFLLLAVAVTRPTANGQCFKVSDVTFTCGDCPGNSACLCFHNGHYCPGTQTVCFELHAIPYGKKIIIPVPTLCYTSQNCKSENGGPCNVVTNQCVLDGEMTVFGAMDYVEICLCPVVIE